MGNKSITTPSPCSYPIFLIHLTAPCFPLTTLKLHLTHYPWARAALPWTTLTFRCYLEPLGHQGQHLTSIFTASGITIPPHTLFFYFSLFHYCCFVWRTAHKSVNRSLVAAYGAITCWVERECQNIQGDIFSQHSYSIWWISLHGRLSLQPCGEHLDSLEGGWDKGQGYVILFTRNHF